MGIGTARVDAAKGVSITITATTFNYVDVEPRVYQPYMQYAWVYKVTNGVH